MRSSEVAERAGVNVQTLRYYERRGLLAEPPRTGSGYRTYPDDAVNIVRFVKRAQEHGFSLTEIDDLLHLADGGPEDCGTARTMAETKAAQLAEKIRYLQRMHASLEELAATCALPRSDRRCPILHTLHTNDGDAR